MLEAGRRRTVPVPAWRAPTGPVVVIVAGLVAVGGLVSAAVHGQDDTAGGRPAMVQLPAGPATHRPPPPQDLVGPRATFKRRFRDVLAQGRSAAGANAAATTLLDHAPGEPDRTLKWLMLVEARELAASAGNAEAVERSIGLAAALYEFDAVETEYRTLASIPLRGLDKKRAAGLARVSERLSDRAEADGRTHVAAAAQTLAVRGWERAGDVAAARRAAVRLTSLEPGRVPGRR
jgi:hypothetical protein